MSYRNTTSDPTPVATDPTTGNPTTSGTVNPFPVTRDPNAYIDPTLLQNVTPLTTQQIHDMWMNQPTPGVSRYRLPENRLPAYTPSGYMAVGLNEDQSNLYNALMNYWNNTPEAVLGAETAMAQRAGTYADTPEFRHALLSSGRVATDARAKILEQRMNELWGKAGVEAPQGGMTRDAAHQDLIKLATQHNEDWLAQGVPTTFNEGIIAGTGFKGIQGTDYQTMLQSALAAYAKIPDLDAAAVKSMGGNKIQGQASQAALDQLQKYLLQQQINELRTKQDLPTSPPGTV